MDYSIRRRDTDVAEDKSDYEESRERAEDLAKHGGYSVLVQAGDSYAVIAANTKARCHELLYGRRPLAEFDAKGEVK